MFVFNHQRLISQDVVYRLRNTCFFSRILTFSGGYGIILSDRGERGVLAMASSEANCATVTRFHSICNKKDRPPCQSFFRPIQLTVRKHIPKDVPVIVAAVGRIHVFSSRILTFSGVCGIILSDRGECGVFAMASFEANCATKTRFIFYFAPSPRKRNAERQNGCCLRRPYK